HTMAAILKEEPPELSGEGKKIPPAAEHVVRHCLEKNPAERFQSARDLAFDLDFICPAPLAVAGPSIYYSAAWGGQPVHPYSTNPNSPESRTLNFPQSA